MPAEEKKRRPRAAPGMGMVLVVDDEEVVRSAAKVVLERHGFEVLLAENGALAVEVFRENAGRVDLILLDMTMPVMAGDEAIRYLHAIRPGVPVIASSGYSEMEANHRFRGSAVSAFIQKPYTSTRLVELVQRVLRSSRR